MKASVPYRLTEPFNLADLEGEHLKHADPLSQQPSSVGFVNLQDFGDETYVLTIKTTKRVVPATVVKREVEERAARWLEQNGFPMGRKMLRETKEQVVVDLLPRAFLSDSIAQVYVVKDLVLCSKASAVFLPLPMKRIVTKDRVPLTEWALDEPPDPFKLGDRLKAEGSQSSLKIQSPKMLTEFSKVAESERRVTELKLLSDLEFVLTEDLEFKGIKYPKEADDDYLKARMLALNVETVINLLGGE